MSSTLSTSETKINNRVASILARLPNNLEPDALLRAINEPTMVSKGDLDNNTLGHAYYTLYHGLDRPRSSVTPASISLLKLYGVNPSAAAEKAAALNVVKQTNPAVYASDVCDAILQYNGVIPPDVFCQAIRNVHPRELKNVYYHLNEICGATFEEHLTMVNRRLNQYFLFNLNLDDVLSGIKKCLCLRMLSSNMYYYRDNPARLDPAIAKLMQFYTLTDFLHASSREAFNAHLHMIGKYNALKRFIDKVLGLGPSFMSTHYFIFDEITHNLDLGLFDRLYDEPAYFPCADFPQCITELKRNISAENIDVLFSMPIHSLSHKQIVDNGLILLQFLENRIKQDNALALDTTADDYVAHEVFQITGEAIDQLPVHTHPHEYTLFAKFYKKLLDKIRISIPLKKKKKVILPRPIRMHSVPFQELVQLIISPRMFRARNIPYRSGSVSVHRASPPPSGSVSVHRPGSVQRMSPPPSVSVHRASPPPSGSVRSMSPPPPSSPRSRKRRREERGGARTKSKRSNRSKKVLIRK